MARSSRYRLDPDYRAATLRRVKARHEELNRDPLYRRMTNLRKRVCSLRDSVNTHLRRAHKSELKLMRAIKQRDQLVELWHQKQKRRSSPSDRREDTSAA